MSEKKIMGAPRKHDYEAIGRKAIEWANLDTSINVLDFCVNYLDPPIDFEYFLDMVRRDKSLSQSYKIAKQKVAIRRERELNAGRLHQATYNKNIRKLDPFTKLAMDEEKEFEHELKKREIEQQNKNLSDLIYKADDMQ